MVAEHDRGGRDSNRGGSVGAMGGNMPPENGIESRARLKEQKGTGIDPFAGDCRANL